MKVLDQYSIKETIYQNNRIVIYRATSEDQSKNVIIKSIVDKIPTISDLQRLKNEFEVAKNFKSQHQIEVFDFGKFNNRISIIKEDFSQFTLKDYINQNEINFEDFFKIAIEICECVEHLHQNNIIHKDITPSNILIDPKTFKCKINDFGIAQMVQNKSKGHSINRQLEGTLLYLSPEQTGRINKVVDHRTDIYSLGYTLYELLTKQHPIANTKDTMEIIHFHIAKMPNAPHQLNSKIPESLSKILMKMIAKNPKKRYQRVYSIHRDLLEIRDRILYNMPVRDFEAGTNDISDKFQLSQNIYGRDEELSILHNLFELVKSGEHQIGMVAGYSGVGKSALINELQKPIAQHKGHFIRGKFDQFNRNIPYTAIIQAITELVNSILTESEEHVNYWKKTFEDVVGKNGKLLIDLIPPIKFILGKQEEVPELPPKEAQNRLNNLLIQFVASIAKKDHPLVLFLDDLQWADLASLNLIRMIASDESIGHLLLIGAYRDNEVNETHPLYLGLNTTRQKHGNVLTEITLEPLAQDSIQEYLMDSLNKNAAEIHDLGELIKLKTNGNPFFMGQFLTQLHHDNFIDFDYNLNGWKWDVKEIQNANITDNVISFMSYKLEQFETKEQELLKLASCIGNRFDLETLAVVSKKSITEVLLTLHQPILEGLIIIDNYPINLIHEFASLLNIVKQNITFHFLHDRVQHAAYSLIANEEKAKYRYEIGRLLLENGKPEEEDLFDVVNHLQKGVELINNPIEKLEYIQLNIKACKKANASNAYDSGLRYIKEAFNHFEESFWERHYNMAYSLHFQLAESYYFNNDVDNSNEIYNALLLKANNNIDKAKVYNNITYGLVNLNKYQEAVQYGMEGMALLGLKVPKNIGKGHVAAELLKVKLKLNFKDPSKLTQLPKMENEEMLQLMALLEKSMGAAYFFNENALAFFLFKMVQISLKHGNAPSSAISYIVYGLIIGPGMGQYQLAYKYGKAGLSVAEQFDNRNLEAKVQVTYAQHLNHWDNHARTNLPYYEKSLEYALETGDYPYAGYNIFNANMTSYLISTEIGKVYNQAKDFYQLSTKIKEEDESEYCRLMITVLERLIHGNEKPTQLDSDTFNEDKFLARLIQGNNDIAIFVFYFMKMQLELVYGHYDHVIVYADQARPYNLDSLGFFNAPSYHLSNCLAIAHQFNHANSSQQRQYLNIISNALKQFKKWSKLCPDNYEHMYYAIKGCHTYCKGKQTDALVQFDLAIESALKNDYSQNAAFINELSSKICSEINHRDKAAFYLENAYNQYKRWGANHKCELLIEQYPTELSNISSIKKKGSKFTPHDTSTLSINNQSIDIHSVLKASIAISEEMSTEKLLSKLITIVIENAGAEKGLLFITENDDLKLKVIGDQEGISTYIEHKQPEDFCVHSLVIYVARTQQSIVIDDAGKHEKYDEDPYVVSNEIKSVFVIPIVLQGNLTGIIYLENNLTSNAFTEDHVEVIKLLAGQTAVSLNNALLYESMEEKVNLRTKELAEKNKDITDSIEYAKNIQSAIIPPISRLTDQLDSFIYYSPKDIVSGDFYFIEEVEDLLVVAAADCTGHGVPGALMSIVGHTGLTKAIQEEKLSKANSILNYLNIYIIDTLRQRDNMNIKDGMDIALCVINKKQGEISFAGAFNPLYKIREGELEIIEADKFAIGGYSDEDSITPFEEKVVKFDQHDTFYIFSDGYADQFGGEFDKKFMVGKFKKLLKRISNDPMTEQKLTLKETIQNWKGSNEQVDDILVMGFRVN